MAGGVVNPGVEGVEIEQFEVGEYCVLLDAEWGRLVDEEVHLGHLFV